jgi:alpha-beta hydrolase superfamily lysophospholipase
MVMDERRFVDAHGVEVFTRWWPIADPVAVVLISHGASEHSGRYDRFARALNAAGFMAVALDHRGHGHTSVLEPRKAVMGVGGGVAVVDDLHELRIQVQVEVGGDVPVFVFGHSMGSLIALAYLVHHAEGLAGTVLCGFPSDLDHVDAFGATLQAAADAGHRDEPVDVLGESNAPFEPARTPSDWLSRDPEEVDRYLADPMCGDDNPLTYGYLLDLFEVLAPARDGFASIACPVLVIAGDRDPAAGMGANPTKLAATLRTAGVDTTLTLYPGARHELLNETNRDDVTADVVAWLQAAGRARVH